MSQSIALFSNPSSSHTEAILQAQHELKQFIDSSDSLHSLRTIPESELYRLFIDADRWGGAQDCAVFDVKEPGYMKAMMNAPQYAKGMGDKR